MVVSARGAGVEIDQERCVALECHPHHRREVPFGSKGCGRQEEAETAACHPPQHPTVHRYVTSFRKSAAKTDFVTSPASSENGALSPSLLARRISVRLYSGNFSTSDE